MPSNQKNRSSANRGRKPASSRSRRNASNRNQQQQQRHPEDHPQYIQGPRSYYLSGKRAQDERRRQYADNYNFIRNRDEDYRRPNYYEQNLNPYYYSRESINSLENPYRTRGRPYYQDDERGPRDRFNPYFDDEEINGYHLSEDDYNDEEDWDEDRNEENRFENRYYNRIRNDLRPNRDYSNRYNRY